MQAREARAARARSDTGWYQPGSRAIRTTRRRSRLYTDRVMTMAHAAAGAAIAHGSRSRVRAVVAALAAHALLDLPRHEDLEMREEGVLTLTTIGVCATLFGVAQPGVLGRVPVLAAPTSSTCCGPDGARSSRRTASAGCTGSLPTPIATAPAQVAAAGGRRSRSSRARRRHAA